MDLAQKAPNVYQAFQTILKKDRLNHAYLFRVILLMKKWLFF